VLIQTEIYARVLNETAAVECFMTNVIALRTLSKILVAVDGSDSSMRAAAAAIELARRYDISNASYAADMKVEVPSSIEVIALYIVDVSPRFELFGKHGFNYAEYGQAAVEAANKATGSWFSTIKENADDSNVRFRSAVMDNSLQSVSGEIIRYAEKEDVDVIVVGTRGHSQFKKLLIGSVSLGVLTYAPCPVIIIR
jgi:nucleotide-binding universal stress UspA family protein